MRIKLQERMPKLRAFLSIIYIMQLCNLIV
nr:MAG TPA: hypothetical protein [Caudoviricetes sp.]